MLRLGGMHWRDVSIKTTFLSSKLVGYKGRFFKKAYASPSGDGMCRDRSRGGVGGRGFGDGLRGRAVF